jgi:ribosomal protein S18 acetylase RimI-like enzyme
MKQLKMYRPSGPVTPCALPGGYAYAPYTGTAEEISDWLAICANGLLPDESPSWFESAILKYPDLNPAKDLFFVVDPAGRRVATSASVCHQNGEGYIHMVGSLPCCRGKGIGRAMLAEALNELERRGCTHTTLTTDDNRLPAIRLYLDAGFRPVLRQDPESDMQARWDAVLAALRYEPVEYLTDV